MENTDQERVTPFFYLPHRLRRFLFFKRAQLDRKHSVRHYGHCLLSHLEALRCHIHTAHFNSKQAEFSSAQGDLELRAIARLSAELPAPVPRTVHALQQSWAEHQHQLHKAAGLWRLDAALDDLSADVLRIQQAHW